MAGGLGIRSVGAFMSEWDLLNSLSQEFRQRLIMEQEGKDIWISPKPGQATCDFCSSPEIVGSVLADDFQMPIPGNHWSRGHWAACSLCLAYIEANEWDALVERVLTTHRAKHGKLPGDEDYAAELYARLRQAMKGIERDKP